MFNIYEYAGNIGFEFISDNMQINFADCRGFDELMIVWSEITNKMFNSIFSLKNKKSNLIEKETYLINEVLNENIYMIEYISNNQSFINVFGIDKKNVRNIWISEISDINIQLSILSKQYKYFGYLLNDFNKKSDKIIKKIKAQ